MKIRSAQFLRKRKLYLALPLLVLPFVTLAFWAMGGGKEKSGELKTDTGLNLQLPDARLKDDKNFDKLSFYNLADKDSLQHLEDRRNDPAYASGADTGSLRSEFLTGHGAYNPQDKDIIQSPFGNNPMEASEQKIYKKIGELKQQINTPSENKAGYPTTSAQNQNVNEQFTRQVDKLQGMMQNMNGGQEKDTEMDQIGSMLDKIMDIQHPDRVKEVKEKSLKNKEKVFSVQPAEKNENITLLVSRTDTGKRKLHNNFYEITNTPVDETAAEQAIEAVVHETQIIVAGSAVKLRLITDVFINGIFIPKGNFIYGIASLENERLSIHIPAIRYQTNLLPVALEVYDLDGLAGIHIPGSISRDVAKQSTAQSVQNIELNSIDPSLAAHAANSGIQAARTLFSKKIKLVKVTLKAGYKILLKDNNH